LEPFSGDAAGDGWPGRDEDIMDCWVAPSKENSIAEPGDSSHRAEGGSERVVVVASTNEVQLLSSEA
jgi:hypothetical protein